MKMTFRWFGPDDPVRIQYIRQIPAVKGIVSALYDVPVGDVWPLEKIRALKEAITAAGLEFSVIESIPVHEDIKLGLATRDQYIENYIDSIRNMGALGIPVLCYNFMPVFDWTRTDLSMKNDDGSTCLCYDHEAIKRIDLSKGSFDLPGWATAYSRDELLRLLTSYEGLGEEGLWDNLSYFLKAVVPAAAENNVVMAIHPDDPPWPIFGLPRIIRDEAGLTRLTSIVQHRSNGITFCTGSLGPNRGMDMIKSLKRFVAMDRIHFVHLRNIRYLGNMSFCETAHPTNSGDIDMHGIMKVLAQGGYRGMARPDHGRMIWGEEGKPGYGLYDRALGAMYLWGLWEGLSKSAAGGSSS